MNLPLPKETRDYFGSDKNRLLRISNLGLLFNKYFYCWQSNWQSNEEQNKVFRQDIEKITLKPKSNDYIQSLNIRQQTAIENLQSSGWHVKFFVATTDSRLIIGLGGTSVIETGMTLHPLYGFPYLPASGLKGLARAYAEIVVEPKPSGEELKEIFGSEDKDPHNVANNRQGKVFFMDGLPTTFPRLELDIMNPHYGDYYSAKQDSKGNAIPPADYLNPVPVTFLTVAHDQRFSFALYSRNADLLTKAKEWLIGGLTQLGAGGKTNVGYGYFKVEPDSTTAKRKDSTHEKDNSLLTRLKAVKNPQTFTNFIKGIKEDETEALSTISFKGMESVINIGLLGALESAEASSEIKKVIAQKMLEVCKEPDKKYTEKIEKYKKLLKIAGITA